MEVEVEICIRNYGDRSRNMQPILGKDFHAIHEFTNAMIFMYSMKMSLRLYAARVTELNLLH